MLKPAHLGDASLLKNPSTAPGGSDTRTLHLEINNCSMLVISSEFQTTWRKYYKRLYLTISDVEDVSQEEAIGYISPISNLISKPQLPSLCCLTMKLSTDCIFIWSYHY